MYSPRSPQLAPAANLPEHVRENVLSRGTAEDAPGIEVTEIDLVDLHPELEIPALGEESVPVVRQDIEDGLAAALVLQEFPPPFLAPVIDDVELVPEPRGWPATHTDVERLAPNDIQVLIVEPADYQRLDIGRAEARRRPRQILSLPDGDLRGCIDV